MLQIMLYYNKCMSYYNILSYNISVFGGILKQKYRKAVISANNNMTAEYNTAADRQRNTASIGSGSLRGACVLDRGGDNIGDW
jgi:hypothetical protein